MATVGAQRADRRQRRGTGDDGAAIVLIAIALVALLVVAAFVLDLGNARQQKRQLQNASDAAALAGAAEIGALDGCPSASATRYALDNLERDAPAELECRSVSTTVDGATVTVTTPYAGGPDGLDPDTLLHVEVCTDVATTLARVIDIESLHICTQSTAQRTEEVSEDMEEPGGTASPIRFPKNPQCSGVPDVDGRIMPEEGYTRIGWLAFEGTIYGDILFTCTADEFMFTMRQNGATKTANVANENVYGDKDYHETYDTGWGDHSFGSLRGSDRARFRVSCGSTAVHDFVQDYMREVDDGIWVSDTEGDGDVEVLGPARSASSMVYNLMHPVETGWGDSLDEDPLEQSPPFSGTYPNLDARYAGWVWQAIYEFSVPRSKYQTCPASPGLFFSVPPFGSDTATKGGVHNSPSKDGTGSSIFSELQRSSGVALVE